MMVLLVQVLTLCFAGFVQATYYQSPRDYDGPSRCDDGPSRYDDGHGSYAFNPDKADHLGLYTEGYGNKRESYKRPDIDGYSSNVHDYNPSYRNNGPETLVRRAPRSGVSSFPYVGPKGSRQYQQPYSPDHSVHYGNRIHHTQNLQENPAVHNSPYSYYPLITHHNYPVHNDDQYHPRPNVHDDHRPSVGQHHLDVSADDIGDTSPVFHVGHDPHGPPVVQYHLDPTADDIEETSPAFHVAPDAHGPPVSQYHLDPAADEIDDRLPVAHKLLDSGDPPVLQQNIDISADEIKDHDPVFHVAPDAHSPPVVQHHLEVPADEIKDTVPIVHKFTDVRGPPVLQQHLDVSADEIKDTAPNFHDAPHTHGPPVVQHHLDVPLSSIKGGTPVIQISPDDGGYPVEQQHLDLPGIKIQNNPHVFQAAPDIHGPSVIQRHIDVPATDIEDTAPVFYPPSSFEAKPNLRFVPTHPANTKHSYSTEIIHAPPNAKLPPVARKVPIPHAPATEEVFYTSPISHASSLSPYGPGHKSPPALKKDTSLSLSHATRLAFPHTVPETADLPDSSFKLIAPSYQSEHSVPVSHAANLPLGKLPPHSAPLISHGPRHDNSLGHAGIQASHATRLVYPGPIPKAATLAKLNHVSDPAYEPVHPSSISHATNLPLGSSHYQTPHSAPQISQGAREVLDNSGLQVPQVPSISHAVRLGSGFKPVSRINYVVPGSLSHDIDASEDGDLLQVPDAPHGQSGYPLHNFDSQRYPTSHSTLVLPVKPHLS